MPPKNFETTKAQAKLVRSAAKGFSEAQFGTSTSEEELPFAERPEDEQADILYRAESLIAKRRDLTRDLRAEHAEPEQAPAYEIKWVNGRPLKIPAPTRTANPFDTADIRARELAESKLVEVKQDLVGLGQIPGFRHAYEKKFAHLYLTMKMAKAAEQYKAGMEELEAKRRDIIMESSKSGAKKGAGAVTGLARERIHALDEEIEVLKEKLGMLKTHEGGEIVDRFLVLKGYGEAAAKNRIVEVPSVKEIVDNVLNAMEEGKPYMLAGHLGSGKTEFARHAARLHMLKNGSGWDPKTEDPEQAYDHLEPEIFSGSDEASIYDLVGKLKLQGRAMDSKTAAIAAKKIAEGLKEHGIDLPETEAAKLAVGQGNIVETIMAYGPLGRALKEDKPIIIDEINLMPPEIVGRINDILLRRVGDKFRLQENGEEMFTRGPGFAVVSTLNLGHQYAGIRDFNAAFASRWIGQEVDYPAPEENFDLMLSALIRKDRTRLPPDFPPESYDKLIALAVVAREIQECFSGQTEGQRFMALAQSASAEKAQLEKVVVSTRDLMRKIIEPYRQSNFRESLDEIIAKNILRPAAISSKDDQTFLTEIFLRRGFFEGWKAEDFAAKGIRTVSQKEIDALQANKGSEEYMNANAKFNDLLGSAHQGADQIRKGLMVGM